MTDEVCVVSRSMLEAHLAHWIVQLSDPVVPAHLTHALEAFKEHWRVEYCTAQDRDLLKNTLLHIFRDIPEIVSWSGRRDNPVSLELLATMVTSAAWIDPYATLHKQFYLPFWKRFWRSLLTPPSYSA